MRWRWRSGRLLTVINTTMMRMMIRNEILELLFWARRNKSLSECLIPYVTMTMLKVITVTMLKITIRHDDDDAGAGGCDDYD